MNRAKRRRIDRINRENLRRLVKEHGAENVWILATPQADAPPSMADDQDGTCHRCGGAVYMRPWVPDGMVVLCRRCADTAPVPLTRYAAHWVTRHYPAEGASNDARPRL